MHYLVGISGGLDSTLAAAALLDKGHRVSGAFLRFSNETDPAPARLAAKELGIDLHEIDCREEFDRTVKLYFARSYAAGKTPNPCVVCNRYLKIEKLCALTEELSLDGTVTGHYADIVYSPDGRYTVRRSENQKKDQSYMLWALTQKQLSLLAFPLSDSDKEALRQAAKKRNFSAANAKESMDVCFLPDGNYADFVESLLGKCPPGNFIDTEGNVLGRHRGIIHYTVGQRKGLGIALGRPAFVRSIDPVKNTVTLVFQGGEYDNRMTVSNLNFQSLPPSEFFESDKLQVKIRYAAPPVSCRVHIQNDAAAVEFHSPVRAVTPGQSAVFYNEDGTIAFGGFIDSVP